MNTRRSFLQRCGAFVAGCALSVGMATRLLTETKLVYDKSNRTIREVPAREWTKMYPTPYTISTDNPKIKIPIYE